LDIILWNWNKWC